MAVKREMLDVATCDACGKRQYLPKGESFEGASGRVHVDLGGVGFPVDFHSCSLDREHLGEALAAAIERVSSE